MSIDGAARPAQPSSARRCVRVRPLRRALQQQQEAYASPALFAELCAPSSSFSRAPHASSNGAANGAQQESRRAAEAEAEAEARSVAVALSLPRSRRAPLVVLLRELPAPQQQELEACSSDEEEEDSSGEQEHHLYLASSLLRLHFGRTRCISHLELRRHEALLLSRVVLRALDARAFAYASAHAAALGAALHARLLRQGEVLRVRVRRDDDGEGAHKYEYETLMSEPVLQGVVQVRQEETDTQVLVTLDEEAAAKRERLETRHVEEEEREDAEEQKEELELDEESEEEQEEEEEGDVTIDERFLAHSVLEDFELPPPSSGEGQVPMDEKTDQLGAGAAASSSIASRSFLCGTLLHISRTLERSAVLASISAWRERRRGVYDEHSPASSSSSSSEEEDVDEDLCLLLDERALAAVGAFEGQWAMADLVGVQGQTRLVRLFTEIDAPPRMQGAPTRRATAQVPPMLWQNLHLDTTFDATSSNAMLSLRPLRRSSLASSSSSSSKTSGATPSCPLPLPFADALTIARVASPRAINRAYQPLFLEALRCHFEARRRVVKQGDVIAVAIEEGRLRWTRKVDQEEEEKEEEEKDEERLVEYDLPSSNSAALATGIVYFRIVALTPELFEPAEALQSTSAQADAALLLQEAARRGEFGCVVETSLSKMVQSGVEHCKVADAMQWLQIAHDLPRRPSSSSSVLTAPRSNYAELLSLLHATLLPRAAQYDLHLSLLLKGARGSGKRTMAHWVASACGVHVFEISCFELLGDSDARTEGALRARFEQAASCGPAILLLRHVEALARKSQAMESGQEPPLVAALKDCIAQLRKATKAQKGDRAAPRPVAVIATTSEAEKCPTGVLGCFKHEITLEAPNEAERLEMLTIALRGAHLSPDVSLKHLATQTAALVAADLVDLVTRARLASAERLRAARTLSGASPSDADLQAAGLPLTGSDFDVALQKARASYSESIGAPKIPNVTWDDVGGLAAVKDDILDTIQLPLEHPELFSDGLKKRSGILLYGPPGTGKTLLAKAVATSCSLNFFSVKGPELLNMYIGESEANVRRVFQRARDAKPCVIFFDELDSVAPKRGNQGDSGGVMDRIVSQLLAELDGMAGSAEGSDVFVIGATNRPDLLDPALLRPGRFDRMLYLSVAETHAAQLNILQALTRKFKLDADVGDLQVIAEQCPFNLTGADFYALASDAMLKAMTRKASQVDRRIEELNARPPPYAHPHPLTPQFYLAELAAPAELEVLVSRADFEGALQELVPSVSEQEMAHYRDVQAKFSKPPAEREEQQASASSEARQRHDGKAPSKGEERQRAQEMLRQLGYDITSHAATAPPISNGSSNPHASRTNGTGPAAAAPAQDPTAAQPHGSAAEKQRASSPAQEDAKGKGKGKARALD